jgi:argonaute-like protein implicated in RNA metabolism and viral defense
LDLKTREGKGILYTTGYIEDFRTYPGAATASPIEINRNYGETELKKLAEQIFALTKMNWNTTALMNKEPVTIEYARKVIEVLKTGLEAEGILKDFRYYI